MNANANARVVPSHADLEQPIGLLVGVCIAIVAYLSASVIHEGLGHGFTAALLGARDIRLSTAALHIDSQSVSPVASRTISIAGPVTGLTIGFLLAVYHANTKSRNAGFRFFLWLTAYVCLFANAGYFMALSLIRFGDIHGFVAGFDNPLAWRLGFTAVGTLLSFAALSFAGQSLEEFLGPTGRRSQAARLVITAYLAGSSTLVLSTLLGKDGGYLSMVSAIPATFGGTIFLPYTALAVPLAPSRQDMRPLTPAWRPFWYMAGSIGVLCYVLVLGPGVPR